LYKIPCEKRTDEESNAKKDCMMYAAQDSPTKGFFSRCGSDA